MAKALIIVDVQNDFVEGGSLAVAGGVNLAHKLADDLERGKFDVYDFIVTTQDFHIDPGAHFSDNPDFVDSWPVHCVADTFGSELVEPLKAALAKYGVDLAVTKGQYEAAYSGFEGHVSSGTRMLKSNQELKDELVRLGVTDVDVVGIAGNYCVKETALDASLHGFNTTVLTDYTVSIENGSVKESIKTLLEEGVKVA